MNYKYICPHCERGFAVVEGSKGRAKCPGCSNRVVVSDTSKEAQSLSETHKVCEVQNSGKRYSTKVVNLDQDLAIALMGSSKSPGDSIYIHCWLLHLDDKIVVQIGTTQVGKLPSAKTGSLLSFAQYSTSPFKNAPCALKCPARFTVVKGDKRILEISIVENPPPISPRSVDPSAIDNELANIRGSLNISSHPNAFTKVTLRQCMDFFENDEDEAEDIRSSARHYPSGPIYYASYRQFDFRSSLDWHSEDSRYFAQLRFDHRYLIVKSIEERPPNLAKIVWISGAPEKKDEQNRVGRLPYHWNDLGRTPSMTLHDSKHVATPVFGKATFCHFWTHLKGIDYPNSDGSSKTVPLKGVRSGDVLIVKRELGNQADQNAIAVYTEGNEQIGYLPRNLASQLCARVALVDIIAHAPEERPPILFLAIGTTTSTKSELRDYAKRAFLTPLDPEW